MVQLFRDAEDALLIAPDRFIRTTDPDHQRASQEMVRRAYRNGDVYLGSYEGWYCPNEGFRQHQRPDRGCVRASTARTTRTCPSSGSRSTTGSSACRATRSRSWPTTRRTPSGSQPEYRRNEMLAFIRNGLDDISISRETFSWGIPFPIREDGSDAVLPDGTPDPAAGVIYVWFDALINYITGAGFPDDPDGFARWWPADLHIVGKDINRFHTIIWPAMLLSAGHRAAAHGLGPRLAAHRRRADVQEPRQLPRSARRGPGVRARTGRAT